MPIYEYACRSCESEFELLIRSSTEPACPSCESEDLKKLLSTFAVGGKSSTFAARAPSGGCGSCGDPRGPGSCSTD